MWDEIEKLLKCLDRVETKLQQLNKLDSILDGCQQIKECYENFIKSDKIESKEDPEMKSRSVIHKKNNNKRKTKTANLKRKPREKSLSDPHECASTAKNHISNHHYLSFDHQLNGRMVINTYYDEKQLRFSPSAA